MPVAPRQLVAGQERFTEHVRKGVKSMSLIKMLLCKHEYEWERNIYGDEINMVGGKRSWWRCRKCGKYKAMPELRLDLEDVGQCDSE